MKKNLAILLLLSNYTHFINSKLIVGDPNAAEGTTFSFTVGFIKHEKNSDNSFPRFWTATDDPSIATMPDDTKKYGLSFINQVASYVNPSFQIKATPMTNNGDAIIFETQDSKVTTSKEMNPIWGAAFSLFDITTQKPIFVLQGQLNYLYGVYNIEHHETADSKENITQLLRYNFGTGEQIHALKGYLDGIYAAYSQGTFGLSSSNIALLDRTKSEDPDHKNITTPYLRLLSSAPVNINTAALIGGSDKVPLASLGSFIGINIVASRVFFCTQAQAGIGGIALPIAQIFVSEDKNNIKTLLFAPIVPVNLITPTTGNTVISAPNPDTIRITATRSMLTSTNLQYMIIARDSGTGPQTIYALPMVTRGFYAGMIADYSSITTKFGHVKPTFVDRYFTNILSDISQIELNNATIQNQIKVGGTSNLPINNGVDIQQIYVIGDSVYAVLGQEYSSSDSPGTYRSQAIFTPEGYIIGWTPWTRVLGSDAQMSYSFVDYKYLTGTYLAAASSSTPKFKSIYQTTFNTNSNLAAFLTAAQGGKGGIQGIFNFNQQTPGFDNALSMLISTAFGKVAFGQTGYSDGGIFKIMQSPAILEFSHEKINDHKALIAAEIAHDTGQNHYIFIGGSTGVSVLSNDTTGVSWNGNLTSVNDLDSEQITWKKIGNFSFVKKLLSDNNYIYVLTSNALYKIKLDPSKFISNSTTELNAEIAIRSKDISSTTYLLDAIIDDGYCLLGTTSGLYRLDNSSLMPIILPGGLPAVSQITAITPNNDPLHSFKALSNIYILNSTFGTQQSKIYRLAIQNGIISMLPDTLVAAPSDLSKGIPSAFLTFNNFISSYFTDGSWNTAQSYYLGPNQPENNPATPSVMQIEAGIHSGQSSSQSIMPKLTNLPSLPFLRFTGNILNMVRETTSGTLIVAGEFEAHTNS
ncbi:hypothetical protein HYV10_01915 [Candidatus Dependentiae bacterium]|nr:hypothetical protein [Candidatus Dependentiae bacterium]